MWQNNESSTASGGSAARIAGGVGTTVASASSITVSDFITPISGTATINTISGPVAGELIGLSSLDGFTIGVAGNITGFAGTMTVAAGSVAFFAREGNSYRVMQGVASGDVILRSGGSQALASDLDLGTYQVTAGPLQILRGANAPGSRATEDLISIGTGALNPGVYDPGSSVVSMAIGYNALAAVTSGAQNIAIGNRALANLTSANNNVAIGEDCGFGITTGASNVLMGSTTGLVLSTGSYNTAVGTGSLHAATTATYNVAIGNNALLHETTGESNVAIGQSAMNEAYAGFNNVAIGTECLWSGIAGNQLSSVGLFNSATSWTFGTGWTYDAVNKKAAKDGDGTGVLTQTPSVIDYAVGGAYRITYTVSGMTVGNVTASFGGLSDTERTADGTYVWNITPTAYPTNLVFTPTGASANTSRFAIDSVSIIGLTNKYTDDNVAVGTGALYHTGENAGKAGSYNTGIGHGAHRQHSTGQFNVAVGVESLMGNGTGDSNVALGRRALYAGNAGSRNVALGTFAGYKETGDDKLFIDNGAWNATPDSSTEAQGRIKALVYGVFGSAPSAQSLTFNAASVIQQGDFGSLWTHGWATEEITIAAAANTDSSANLLPANSIIEAVVVRVTTVIPTAATFTVGDATQAARFATGVAVAAGTTSVGLLHTDPTVAAATLGPTQTAAAKIRITPNIQPLAATGKVRVTVFYRQFTAPTS